MEKVGSHTKLKHLIFRRMGKSIIFVANRVVGLRSETSAGE